MSVENLGGNNSEDIINDIKTGATLDPESINPGSFNDFITRYPSMVGSKATSAYFKAQHEYIEALAASKGVDPEDLHRQQINYRD